MDVCGQLFSLVSFICYIGENVLVSWLFSAIFLTLLGIIGQFAGSHRLWAHHSYKATSGLKVFLMLCQSLVGHVSISVKRI